MVLMRLPKNTAVAETAIHILVVKSGVSGWKAEGMECQQPRQGSGPGIECDGPALQSWYWMLKWQPCSWRDYICNVTWPNFQALTLDTQVHITVADPTAQHVDADQDAYLN